MRNASEDINELVVFSANIGTRWLLVTLFYYIELKLLVHYVIQSTKLGEFLSCSIQNIKNC